MAFKSDRSFLDKLSMGATGAIQAKRILTEHGHNVIELERYSTSNKIWATKVKRLRVPDLLCLRCGRRMEVRSKSNLSITMSHSPTVQDRQWDYGLRDEDLVLLIACRKETETSPWIPSEVINAFSISDLRRMVELAKLGPPKSASEGAERDLTWPSYVPSLDTQVVEVTDQFLTLLKEDGKRLTYNLAKRGFLGYVAMGDRVQGGSTIVASVIPQKSALHCAAAEHYDFTPELESQERETLYCAVKAVGHIPELGLGVAPQLLEIARGRSDDTLVQLEAYASLARLGVHEGWGGLERSLHTGSAEVRMETVLILDELNLPTARDLLLRIAEERLNDPELRASAVWGLGHYTDGNPVARLLAFLDDADRNVAVHAVTACLPHVTRDNLGLMLRHLGPHARSAAIVRILVEIPPEVVAQEAIAYFLNGATEPQKPWILYLLGLLGQEACLPLLQAQGEMGAHIVQSVSLLWNQHKRNWTNAFDIQDLLDYTMRQHIRGV